MSTHALYVTAAYAVSALGLAGLVAWILLDRRGRSRDLERLEAAGVRRRSEARTKAP
jgi:heme exporter protein D